MTEANEDPTPTPATAATETPGASAARPWYRRRWFLFGAPVALLGLFAAKGFAHGFHHGPFRRGSSEVELLERAKDVVAIAARRLDLSAEQQTKLEALADERIPRLVKLRAEAEALREKLREAAVRDDRKALEALRGQGVALADRGSREALDAYGKLSDVLTPPQRAELLEHLGRHRGRHGGHGPAHGHGHRHGR